MKRYPKLEHAPGKWSRWVYPARSEFRLACCDCGLIHDMQFSSDKHGIGKKYKFRMRRNMRATAAQLGVYLESSSMYEAISPLKVPCMKPRR